MVTDDTLIVADTTDLAKYYARHLEGLGRVHDGSDPEGRTAPGYCIFEAFVRVGKWQLFPLVVEPLKVYAGAATGENAEILGHVLRVHEAAREEGDVGTGPGLRPARVVRPVGRATRSRSWSGSAATARSGRPTVATCRWTRWWPSRRARARGGGRTAGCR